MGAQPIPTEQRFGIMPQGTLIQFPAVTPEARFMMQLVEPPLNVMDSREYLQRIGLGVPDVMAAVRELRGQHVEFIETTATHTEVRGAITKTYEQAVVFELVQSERGGGQ